MKRSIYLVLLSVFISCNLYGQREKRQYLIEFNFRLANTFYWGDGEDMYFKRNNVYGIRRANAGKGGSVQLNVCSFVKEDYAIGLLVEINQFGFQQELITNIGGGRNFSEYWLGIGFSQRYRFMKRENADLSFTNSFSFDNRDNGGLISRIRKLSDTGFSAEMGLSYRFRSINNYTFIIGTYFRTAIIKYKISTGSFWPYAGGLSVGVQI